MRRSCGHCFPPRRLRCGDGGGAGVSSAACARRAGTICVDGALIAKRISAPNAGRVRNTFQAPMRRRLIQLGLFVLAGAIVNVAVAWMAPRPSFLAFGLLSPTSSRFAHYSAWWLTHREISMRPESISTASTWGFEHVAINAATEGGSRLRAGWPALGLEGVEVNWVTQLNPLQHQRETKDLLRVEQMDQSYPLRPLWPGFAINTLFYAGILWLLFAAPFALRRRRRIKRGLCPACAYPVGDSEVCTECGQAVKPIGDALP
jgi:hypothetical protein